jgi:hypothetical protein
MAGALAVKALNDRLFSGNLEGYLKFINNAPATLVENLTQSGSIGSKSYTMQKDGYYIANCAPGENGQSQVIGYFGTAHHQNNDITYASNVMFPRLFAPAGSTVTCRTNYSTKAMAIANIYEFDD